MWRDALLVAGKDLRIELRSRVVLNQVAPFAVLVLVLFALALGPASAPMVEAAPGLFWLAVLFALVLAVQRSFGVESAEGARDGLRLSGLDPASIFLGKLAATSVQLFVLDALLVGGVILFYGARVRSPGDLVAAAVAGTIGLAAAGTLYGAMSAGLRVRDTLLPLLLLPVASPVLLAGTRAWQAALGTGVAATGPWTEVLVVFTVIYLALGVVIYGPLQEAA